MTAESLLKPNSFDWSNNGCLIRFFACLEIRQVSVCFGCFYPGVCTNISLLLLMVFFFQYFGIIIFIYAISVDKFSVSQFIMATSHYTMPRSILVLDFKCFFSSPIQIGKIQHYRTDVCCFEREHVYLILILQAVMKLELLKVCWICSH